MVDQGGGRRATVLAVLSGSGARRDTEYLHVRLEPSLPWHGIVHEEAVLTERHRGDSLRSLGRESISVYLLAAGPLDAMEGGVFHASQEGLLGWADAALDPAFLPETQEAGFERVFAAVRAYAEREGSSTIPQDHLEGGLAIGVWARNVRHSRQIGELRPDWAARLETLPGWRWYDQDEFALLEGFAAREGHTDVPADFEVDERALGSWVAFTRSSRRFLSPDWIARLEAIPHWHW